MQKVLVSVSNDLNYDQRVKRSCSVLQEMGFSILLLGRKLPHSSAFNAPYPHKRFKLWFNKNWLFYANLNVVLFFKLLFTKAHLLYSNDLDTLLANFLVSKLKGIPLIYDSHELFTEVPELQGKWQQKIWLKLEAWIFPKLHHIITVNESIANFYRTKYHKKIEVIRNIAELDTNIQVANIPKATNFTLILQGAGINVDRGAEELLTAMLLLKDVDLWIVGDGDVVPQLKLFVAKNNLNTRVHFLPKCAPKELKKITPQAHLGLSLDKASNLNYQWSLPNKLFDYIHAEIPVLCSDLIEPKQIIQQLQVGWILQEVSALCIAQKIQSIQKNTQEYTQKQLACKLAKHQLNWQHESIQLKNILKTACLKNN